MTGADDDFRLVLIVANGVAAIEARQARNQPVQRKGGRDPDGGQVRVLRRPDGPGTGHHRPVPPSRPLI